MQGRLVVNVVLLAVAVALGVWIYRDVRGSDAELLSTLDPDAVQRIDVERRGEQTLAFTRSDAGWRMLSPGNLPASNYHIDLLLRLLRRPVDARYSRGEIDLAGAGLAQPAQVVSFDGRRYAFGGLDPIGQRRYLLHEENVLLVREGVSAILASPWWNFVDRRLLVAGEPKSVQFADGRSVALDEDTAQRAHWQHSSASIVRPIPPGLQGEPLVLELESGERIRWQWIDGEQPRLLRPDLGLAYEVSAEQLDALLGRPNVAQRDE
jgi:hypothetical protein